MGSFRRPVLDGLTFLAVILIPVTVALSNTLREEAVSYRTQGYEAQRRGDAATALTYYQKAAALDPSYPTPHNDIGIVLEEQGRLSEAEASYQRALALNPNYLEAHANLAMLYERMGEREKAISHWRTRYELGEGDDPWTARAEERLVALGVLSARAGLKGTERRRLTDDAFRAHAQSIKDFRSLTETHGNWP
ncbi:MAG: tetratricopeptide repeat protein [Candidatus Omnitrophica bacterium]|nr:tetratricopeptide repeat protein [Candidatus Omnitrophota bacterium]